MSVIYKERERERDREWDDRGQPRTFTTVRRYRVPDRGAADDDAYSEKKLVIRRERDPPSREREREREREPPRREVEYRVVEREREIEREPPPPREVREYRFERDVERAPSQRAPSPPPPERVREWRFERDVEREPPRREREREPYELEKYSRSTEYFAPPEPRPIIIRQDPQPIIIQEGPRQPIVLQRDEPHYETIERDEVRDDRQLVRREEPPPPQRQSRRDDEDYYYERRVREVDRGPRRGGGGGEAEDDFYDEREYRRSNRRDIDPRDSASQYEGGYSSDDSLVVIRKERTEGGSRDRSPHHRRHLAEGAIAGLGAAEILRHHRKAKGEDPGHRGRRDLGAAALGAVGAEVLSRARSRRRSRSSRSRSRSSSRSYRSTRKGRRKHRSRSQSRVRTLAGLGTVAVVGALAGYALRNRGNKETVIVNERRSRSRRRRGSVDSGVVEQRPRSASRATDPEHRNRRIAQAGLASAAAAGIWQRVRSKSRGGKSRSRSRIRTGVPIAAAGLGGAAVAGLYERNKARKAEKREGEMGEGGGERGARSRSRSRSKSRSRSRSAPYPDDDEPPLHRTVGDPALIEYGDDPIYPERRAYEDGPGEYRRRRRGSSASSSPDGRRRRRSGSRSRSRSRSRVRGLAGAAAAAGAAGLAAHEVTKRRERQRRRREEEDSTDPYAHDHDPASFTPPLGPNYSAENQAYYPQTNQFPPPPTHEYHNHRAGGVGDDYPGARGGEAEYGRGDEYPPYNPSDYPPPMGGQGQQHPGQTLHGDEGRYEGYPPSANDAYANEQRYMNEQQSGGGGGGGGGGAGGGGRHNHQAQGPENVSERFDIGNAGGVFEDDLPGGCLVQPLDPVSDGSDGLKAKNRANAMADGLRTPRGKSPGRVRFESPVEVRRGRGGADGGFADGDGEIDAGDVDAGDGYGHDGGRRERENERNRSDRRRTRGDTSDLVSDPTGADDHDPDPDPRRRSHRHRHRRRKTHSESPTPTPVPGYNSKPDATANRRLRSASPASSDSSETVDLPPRFDAQGRRVPEKGEDPLADGIEELLGGKGAVGALLKGLLGGGGGRR